MLFIVMLVTVISKSDYRTGVLMVACGAFWLFSCWFLFARELVTLCLFPLFAVNFDVPSSCDCSSVHCLECG
jgi:hypothetical protein